MLIFCPNFEGFFICNFAVTMIEQSEMETEFADGSHVTTKQPSTKTRNSNNNKDMNGSRYGLDNKKTSEEKSEFTPRTVTNVIILLFINLLNYADRAVVPGQFDGRIEAKDPLLVGWVDLLGRFSELF